ncbi:MAG TPA: AmmeMemoRadiSam system protein A [Vicinamibacterales bacterium]|nr:AmmeMemoRadiSam system protein A [Vicinamibacterales bacterium]
MELLPDDRQRLLQIARGAIDAAVHGRRPPPERAEGPLAAPGGTFVTLHHRGELRGCIGQIEAREPLAEAVAHCAVSAALRDPRFRPLTPGELENGTAIEISVLTPMQRVESVDEIEVGRDGLLIRQGHRSGLLLPQVATEWRWDRDTFLAQTCRKAGLAPDAWRHGAEIYKFQAQVFGE